MATRYATASQSDSSLGSNEWLEGFSPQTLRPIISKDSESKYMSATNINPYDTLIARPCDSDDDPLLGPPKQQPRGTGTIAPTGLDSIQQTIKDVMRESIKDLKNDILAPLAQRIIDIEERVEKIENKMESANTKTAQQNKEAQKRNRQNDSEINRLNDQIERISQELRQLPSQPKTVPSSPEKINNLVIAGVDEEEGEDVNKKVVELANKLKCELTYFHASRLGQNSRTNENKKRGPRPILVRFATVWERRKLFACREKLKNTEDQSLKQIFINDDLDKEQSTIYYMARKAKKQKLIYSTWIYQGTVHIAKENKGTPIIIRTRKELTEHIPEIENRTTRWKQQRHCIYARKIVRTGGVSGNQ